MPQSYKQKLATVKRIVDKKSYNNRSTQSSNRAIATAVRRMAPMALQRQPLYRAPAVSEMRRAVANSKESGFVDLATAQYPMDTTGSITLLATVPQGASVNQRIGKKALWKSVQCRGYITNSTTASSNDVAFLIVYDKRPTGALPAVTDILVASTSQSFNNDANSGRFSVLKRYDTMLLGAITGTIATEQLTDTTAQSADFYLDLKQKPVVFKAAGTGAIGDIEEGALYLVTVGDHAAGTTAAIANLSFRVRYHDC